MHKYKIDLFVKIYESKVRTARDVDKMNLFRPRHGNGHLAWELVRRFIFFI